MFSTIYIRPDAVFGAAHLLRLLVHLPAKLEYLKQQQQQKVVGEKSKGKRTLSAMEDGGNSAPSSKSVNS